MKGREAGKRTVIVTCTPTRPSLLLSPHTLQMAFHLNSLNSVLMRYVSAYRMPEPQFFLLLIACIRSWRVFISSHRHCDQRSEWMWRYSKWTTLCSSSRFLNIGFKTIVLTFKLHFIMQTFLKNSGCGGSNVGCKQFLSLSASDCTYSCWNSFNSECPLWVDKKWGRTPSSSKGKPWFLFIWFLLSMSILYIFQKLGFGMLNAKKAVRAAQTKAYSNIHDLQVDSHTPLIKLFMMKNPFWLFTFLFIIDFSLHHQWFTSRHTWSWICPSCYTCE